MKIFRNLRTVKPTSRKKKKRGIQSTKLYRKHDGKNAEKEEEKEGNRKARTTRKFKMLGDNIIKHLNSCM